MPTLLAASAVREIDRPALMLLFWLAHVVDGERRARIQEGGGLIFARLHAAIDGFFVEAHELDARAARKAAYRSRADTKEAAALLDGLE